MSSTATSRRQDITTAGTVTERLLEMESKDFGRFIDQKWNALVPVVKAIVQQVEGGALEPYEGGLAIAALTASVFGYEEFNPRSGKPLAHMILAGSDS